MGIIREKYKSEVASVKIFIVGKFLNFKISDTVSVVKHVKIHTKGYTKTPKGLIFIQNEF